MSAVSLVPHRQAVDISSITNANGAVTGKRIQRVLDWVK